MTSAKPTRRKPKPADLLAAVPMQNASADLTDGPGGKLLVAVPLKRPGWLVPPISWVLPFSSHRRVELDEIGAAVFRACNGERTVEEIIEAFAARHALDFREAQLPVTQFLRQMTQRGLIVLAGFDTKAKP
jgi:hypothetical protein